jgi:hypothetical protein
MLRKIVVSLAMMTILLFLLSISVFAATVQQRLANPESGWTRYEQTNPAFTYTGTWLTENLSANSAGHVLILLAQVKRSGGIYTTIATSSAIDTHVTNGTTYYYVVSAFNTSGESANSCEVSATPKLTIPTAPTSLAFPEFFLTWKLLFQFTF